MTYRIRDWNAHYENNRTRELKKLDWVPVPNRMDGSGYSELVDHPNGAAHLGAWLAILEIASRCKVRGTLAKDPGTIPQEGAGCCGEVPITSRDLARMSRLSADLFDEVLPRLVAIGWVEVLENLRSVEIPQDGAGKCGTDARARSVPFSPIPSSSIQIPRARDTGRSPGPERFTEWLRAWTRVGNRQAALQAWISVVVSPEDEAAAFAARDRYMASDEVARNVIMEPAKWLYDQARGGWQGRWPAAKANGRQAVTECRRDEVPTEPEYWRGFGADELAALAADRRPVVQQLARAEQARRGVA